MKNVSLSFFFWKVWLFSQLSLSLLFYFIFQGLITSSRLSILRFPSTCVTMRGDTTTIPTRFTLCTGKPADMCVFLLLCVCEYKSSSVFANKASALFIPAVRMHADMQHSKCAVIRSGQIHRRMLETSMESICALEGVLDLLSINEYRVFWSFFYFHSHLS